MTIRVELVGGRDIVCDPQPGRTMLVGPSHTFLHLAEAIDAAFARWDLSHLHMFELADGRRVSDPAPDWDDIEDESLLKVGAELRSGDRFVYVFDLGDNWTHACQVEADDVDPWTPTERSLASPFPSGAGGGFPINTGADGPAILGRRKKGLLGQIRCRSRNGSAAERDGPTCAVERAPAPRVSSQLERSPVSDQLEVILSGLKPAVNQLGTVRCELDARGCGRGARRS
jgi:hypothetical protein